MPSTLEQLTALERQFGQRQGEPDHVAYQTLNTAQKFAFLRRRQIAAARGFNEGFASAMPLSGKPRPKFAR